MNKNSEQDSHDNEQNDAPESLQDEIHSGYARRSFDEEEAETPTLWLITFTDIMALMLTFFVLLYSMTEPEEKRWSDLKAAIGKQFGQYRAPEFNEGQQDSINIEKIDFNRALDLNYLSSIISETLSKAEFGDEVVITIQSDRLIISLPHDVFFDTGRSEIGVQGQRALFKIGDVLMRIRNAIEVVGHADPRRPSVESGRTNWDLSLERAASVGGALEKVGYTKPFAIRGMSSARYDDLSQDFSEEERLDLSRRVDIVILKNNGSLRRSLVLE